MNKRQG